MSVYVARYACFLEGAPLIRLTGCWDPRLEFFAWSNVVCTLEGNVLEDILQASCTLL